MANGKRIIKGEETKDDIENHHRVYSIYYWKDIFEIYLYIKTFIWNFS